MSEYRVRASGELKSETDLRLENRNVSFPKVWNTNVFEALGIDPVLATPAPTPSGEFKIVARNGAVQDSNGNWVQAWVEREMFTEYTDEEGNKETKMKGSLFDYIIALLYLNGSTGNRIAMRLLYMLLQLLLWVADKDEGTNDQVVHYAANMFCNGIDFSAI